MTKRYRVKPGKLLVYGGRQAWRQAWNQCVESETHDRLHVSDFTQLMLFGLDVYDDGSNWPGDVLWNNVNTQRVVIRKTTWE